MNLEEAIQWAERKLEVPKQITYYVIPWNQGFCVVTENHIKKHPHIKWVYNTKDKEIVI